MFYVFEVVLFLALQDQLELHAPYNLWDCARTLLAAGQDQTVNFINAATIPTDFSDQYPDIIDGWVKAARGGSGWRHKQRRQQNTDRELLWWRRWVSLGVCCMYDMVPRGSMLRLEYCYVHFFVS